MRKTLDSLWEHVLFDIELVSRVFIFDIGEIIFFLLFCTYFDGVVVSSLEISFFDF